MCTTDLTTRDILEEMSHKLPEWKAPVPELTVTSPREDHLPTIAQRQESELFFKHSVIPQRKQAVDDRATLSSQRQDKNTLPACLVPGAGIMIAARRARNSSLQLDKSSPPVTRSTLRSSQTMENPPAPALALRNSTTCNIQPPPSPATHNLPDLLVPGDTDTRRATLIATSSSSSTPSPVVPTSLIPGPRTAMELHNPRRAALAVAPSSTERKNIPLPSATSTAAAARPRPKSAADVQFVPVRRQGIRKEKSLRLLPRLRSLSPLPRDENSER